MKSLKIIILFFALFLLGCKIPKPLALNSKTAMPKVFGSESDTAFTTELNWKIICADSILKSIIDSALVNNNDIKIVMQRLEIARAQVRYYRGLQLPSIHADVSTGIKKYGDYTEGGVGNYDTRLSPNLSTNQIIPNPISDYYVGAFSSWEIDVWGKYRNKKKSAVARFWATEQGIHLLKTNLIAEVAITYYQLLSLDSKLQILNENITLQEKELRIVSIQKQAGHVTELAVKQFESQLLNGKSDKVEIIQQIVETENRLNYLLGKYPQNVKRDKHILENELPVLIRTGLPSNILLNRPDIQQAEMELIASNADVKAARAAFFPSLTLSANIGFNAYNQSLLLNTPGSLAYHLLGGITTPLLNRSALRAQYGTVKAEQIQYYWNYQKVVLHSYQEVHGLLQKIENLSTQYLLKEMEIKVLTSAINSWGELFISGRASYLEVLISQKRLLQARLEQIDTKQNQFNSVVYLYKALGGGWK